MWRLPPWPPSEPLLGSAVATANVTKPKLKEKIMIYRTIAALGATCVATATFASQGPVAVIPEVGTTGGVVAVAAVAAVGVLAWERKRRNKD